MTPTDALCRPGQTAPELIPRLRNRLAAPLPGRRVQERFAPELSYGRHHGPVPADARQAAVMLLLYLHQGRWCLPLTVRPLELVRHGGQVSLPGGEVDAGESPVESARRELFEELGVAPAAYRLVGMLTPLYVFASNFRVTPYVAVAAERPLLQPAPAEVAAVIEPAVEHLSAAGRGGSRTLRRFGVSFDAPCFDCQGACIWGATAMILGEFLAVVRSDAHPARP